MFFDLRVVFPFVFQGMLCLVFYLHVRCKCKWKTQMTLCPCVTAFLDAQYENAKCCAVARCANVSFSDFGWQLLYFLRFGNRLNLWLKVFPLWPIISRLMRVVWKQCSAVIKWIILITSFTAHALLLARLSHNCPTISCIQYQNTAAITSPTTTTLWLMQRPAPG